MDAVRFIILCEAGFPELSGNDGNSIHVMEANRLRELIILERQLHPHAFHQFELQLLEAANALLRGPIQSLPAPRYSGPGDRSGPLLWSRQHTQLVTAYIDPPLGIRSDVDGS